jgi:hypothetical protein
MVGVGLALVEELVNVESIRIIEGGDDFKQIVARVSVDRTETIAHGDVFPHFEGHRYRSLGTMQLVDGEDWKPNHLGVDVRLVEVGVVEVEPDGTSFIRMRLPKSFLGPPIGWQDEWPIKKKSAAKAKKKKRKR